MSAAMDVDPNGSSKSDSGPTYITSPAQLQSFLRSKVLTAVLFYKADDTHISSAFAAASSQISSESVGIGLCEMKKFESVRRQYELWITPTVLAFRRSDLVMRLEGAKAIVDSLNQEDFVRAIITGGVGKGTGADGGESDNAPEKTADESPKHWLGAALPRSFVDVTANISKDELDIMNSDSEFGDVRILFDPSIPSAISKAKTAANPTKDWIESDTDEQLMLFMRFQTAIKLHSLQITSLPACTDGDGDDESPSRPCTIKLFVNTPYILGFEDANEREATQTVELTEKDWDSKNGTAVVNTRFVKFQNTSAVTVFFVDVQREGGERVRVDRIRIIGEKNGDKMDLNKAKMEITQE